MRPTLLSRVAAVLLVLFAVGHTVGFRQVDPQWGIDAVIIGMRTGSFQILGVQRSYWDFFVGFGFFVTVLLLFAALVAWQLATLDLPLLFSLAIALCLALAAWSSGGASSESSHPYAD